MVVVVFFVWVFAEIAVLIQVGSWIGVLNTCGLLLSGSVIGIWLVQRQGVSFVRRLRTARATRSVPPGSVIEGLLLGVAGLLFVVPGFLSDAVGLVLVPGPVRRAIAGRVRRRLGRSGWTGSTRFDLD